MSMSPGDATSLQRALAQAVHDHWVLFLVEGIVLVILGLLAIVVPQIASLAVTILVGWLFLISGGVGLVTTFMARAAPGFWWALLSAVLGIAAGIVLLVWPIGGIVTLTLLLIVFFTIEGVVTIMYALDHKKDLLRAMGLDAGERDRRSRAGGDHFRRAAGHCRLGDRPPGRDQHAVRRHVVDRDRVCTREQRAGAPPRPRELTRASARVDQGAGPNEPTFTAV